MSRTFLGCGGFGAGDGLLLPGRLFWLPESPLATLVGKDWPALVSWLRVCGICSFCSSSSPLFPAFLILPLVFVGSSAQIFTFPFPFF